MTRFDVQRSIVDSKNSDKTRNYHQCDILLQLLYRRAYRLQNTAIMTPQLMSNPHIRERPKQLLYHQQPSGKRPVLRICVSFFLL